MPSFPTFRVAFVNALFFIFTLISSVECKGGGKGGGSKGSSSKSKSKKVKLPPKVSAILGGAIAGGIILLVLIILIKSRLAKRKQRAMAAAGEDREAQQSELSTPEMSEKVPVGHQYYGGPPPAEPLPIYADGRENFNNNNPPAFPMPMPTPQVPAPHQPWQSGQPQGPN